MFGIASSRPRRALPAALAAALCAGTALLGFASPSSASAPVDLRLSDAPSQWATKQIVPPASVLPFVNAQASGRPLEGWTPRRYFAQRVALADVGTRSDARNEALAFPPAWPARRPSAEARDVVMGSIPIEVSRVAQSARWRTLLRENVASLFSLQCAHDAPECNVPLARAASKTIARLTQETDARRVVSAVNAFVNRKLLYREDMAAHHVADRWSTIAETMRLGVGDCEEFAFMKRAMLRQLGFEESQLRLVLLRIPARGVDHAVLIVNLAGEQYVLDNLVADVYKDTQARGYVPMISLVAEHAYIHGFQRNTGVASRETARRALRL